jgi:hypothetical protein
MNHLATPCAACAAAAAPAAQAIEFNQFQPAKELAVLRLQADERAGRWPVQELPRQACLRPGQTGRRQGGIRNRPGQHRRRLEGCQRRGGGKAWFNTREFPVARFVATTVKPLGNNRYEVAGKMSIKGKTRDLVTPVTVTQQGNSASFDGSLVFKRADYGIGDGIWADFGTVANEIQIKFRLVASASEIIPPTQEKPMNKP